MLGKSWWFRRSPTSETGCVDSSNCHERTSVCPEPPRHPHCCAGMTCFILAFSSLCVMRSSSRTTVKAGGSGWMNSRTYASGDNLTRGLFVAAAAFMEPTCRFVCLFDCSRDTLEKCRFSEFGQIKFCLYRWSLEGHCSLYKRLNLVSLVWCSWSTIWK